MESFFALLQKNVLDRQRWTSREQLKIAIITWIEQTYHRRRRQRGLGKFDDLTARYMMPLETVMMRGRRDVGVRP